MSEHLHSIEIGRLPGDESSVSVIRLTGSTGYREVTFVAVERVDGKYGSAAVGFPVERVADLRRFAEDILRAADWLDGADLAAKLEAAIAAKGGGLTYAEIADVLMKEES